MHASVVMPLLESPEVTAEAKRRIADLVVRKRRLIAGNFSEAGTTSLIGERPLATTARRVDGGYSITGRKMFASMLEAADYCLVMAHPEGAAGPLPGILLLVPRNAEGRSVDANWDVLGMRATRSNSLMLDDCRLPESAALFRSDDIRPFRHDHLNWFWGSYTAVYLGLAAAAYDVVRKAVHARRPQGYRQALAYHPDVRRQVAQMSAELEAARLVTYHSAWLSDTHGPTPETTAALYRAKYVVGEAVSRITRDGADARRRARHLQRLPPRAAVPRRRAGADPAAPAGFLPAQYEPLRARARPRGPAPAAPAGIGGLASRRPVQALPVTTPGQS